MLACGKSLANMGEDEPANETNGGSLVSVKDMGDVFVTVAVPLCDFC